MLGLQLVFVRLHDFAFANIEPFHTLSAATRLMNFYIFAAIGALLGALAKGGPQSGDAPYVIPSGMFFGTLNGLLVFILAARKI
jgi:hypothetical protein